MLVCFFFHFKSEITFKQLLSIQFVISILQLVSKLKKKTQNKNKNTSFMPHRNRDNLEKFLPNTPTTSNSQPSLFFGGCELEDPLGEQPEIFEEPT